MFIFLCRFLNVFTRLYDIKYFYLIRIVLYTSTWFIDGTLKDTTIPGQGEPGSNANEEVLPKALELEPHHQMQFSVILMILFWSEEGLLSRGYSIVSPEGQWKTNL